MIRVFLRRARARPCRPCPQHDASHPHGARHPHRHHGGRRRGRHGRGDLERHRRRDRQLRRQRPLRASADGASVGRAQQSRGTPHGGRRARDRRRGSQRLGRGFLGRDGGAGRLRRQELGHADHRLHPALLSHPSLHDRQRQQLDRKRRDPQDQGVHRRPNGGQQSVRHGRPHRSDHSHRQDSVRHRRRARTARLLHVRRRSGRPRHDAGRHLPCTRHAHASWPHRPADHRRHQRAVGRAKGKSKASCASATTSNPAATTSKSTPRPRCARRRTASWGRSRCSEWRWPPSACS